MLASIDINSDLGEGAGTDALLMPLISSANIACGAHAGNEATMRKTDTLARRHGVVVGAHPGYPDRENSGAFRSRWRKASWSKRSHVRSERCSASTPI